jgi:hypothetical protein
MQVTLTIIRYPKHYSVFALFAMALHRFPLWRNKKISFYKLMGCGKNGTFDKNPDWQQWAILTVQQQAGAINIEDNKRLVQTLYGNWIAQWFQFFNCETWTIFLQPIEGHGTWDGKEPFGKLPPQTDYTGPLAVLTRASIRLSKLKNFWQNVPGVASQMATAKGLITSIGVGEIPLIKQATFSVWQNKEAMKNFAYQMHQHTAVIQKTRKEKWYSEDMFVRFVPLKTVGRIKDIDPLEGKL